MALADTLKAAGLSEDQVKAIETEATAEAAKLKADAEAAQVKAERERASVREWWEKEATPELSKVASERDTAKAEAAYYRTQNEAARKDGFIPADAPGYKVEDKPPETDPTKTRDTNGRFTQPPRYLTQEEAIHALTAVNYINNEHFRLTGEMLPGEAMQEFVNESGRRSGPGVRVTAQQVWEEKFKIPELRAAKVAAEKKAAEDAIRKDEREKAEREMAERYGNNPNLRSPETSSFANIARAESAKKDVPMWQRPERERRAADRALAREALQNDPMFKRGTQRVQ